MVSSFTDSSGNIFITQPCRGRTIISTSSRFDQFFKVPVGKCNMSLSVVVANVSGFTVGINPLDLALGKRPSESYKV